MLAVSTSLLQHWQGQQFTSCSSDTVGSSTCGQRQQLQLLACSQGVVGAVLKSSQEGEQLLEGHHATACGSRKLLCWQPWGSAGSLVLLSEEFEGAADVAGLLQVCLQQPQLLRVP